MAETIQDDTAALLTLVARGRPSAVSDAELAELRSEGFVEKDAFRLTSAGSRSLRRHTEQRASEQLGAWLMFVTAIAVAIAAVIWWVSMIHSPSLWTLVASALFGSSVALATLMYRIFR